MQIKKKEEEEDKNMQIKEGRTRMVRTGNRQAKYYYDFIIIIPLFLFIFDSHVMPMFSQ